MFSLLNTCYDAAALILLLPSKGDDEFNLRIRVILLTASDSIP